MSGASKIEQGDLVIYTDADKPCARLLAIVTDVQDDLADIMYVRLGRAIKNVLVSELTCLGDFGLRVNDFDKDGDSLLLLEPSDNPHTAQYLHGDAGCRVWQGDHACVVHKDARPHVSAWY